MFTIILLLIIAGLCFAYLRSTQQTKSAKDDAKCWKLLAQMYDNWSATEFENNQVLRQQRDDAYLSIEIMALGLEQERRDHETALILVLNQKEPA
jgi:hypothetical protein